MDGSSADEGCCCLLLYTDPKNFQLSHLRFVGNWSRVNATPRRRADMSMAGLGLEWVRRKHPELRPEHPGHRRQRFCRAADAEQLAHAAALRESSLQKREAAACRCRRPVPPTRRSTTRGSSSGCRPAGAAGAPVAAAALDDARLLRHRRGRCGGRAHRRRCAERGRTVRAHTCTVM